MSKLTPKVLEIAAEAVSYGVRRAFALSLADVDCLSRTDDIGFIDRDNSGIAVG